MFNPDDEALRRCAEIEARVRPTIGPTFSSRGETVEGRITEADFDTLLELARAGAEPKEGR